MASVITPTPHERAEWARLSRDAYRVGRLELGARFAHASTRAGALPISVFDELQQVYRSWLNWGFTVSTVNSMKG